MSEEIEGYENNLELELFKEYRDVIGLFKYVVETERRFYLCNHVDVQARPVGGDVFFELTLSDAWVWDIYRSSRFVRSVRVITYKDVNVEELSKPELDIPEMRMSRSAVIHRPFREPLPIHRGRFSHCVSDGLGRTVGAEVIRDGMLNTARSSGHRCCGRIYRPAGAGRKWSAHSRH